MSENAVAVPANTGNTLRGLNDDGGFYTSLAMGSRADKMAMLKAVNDSKPLKDFLGEKIPIVDFVAQQVDINNEQTGEIEPAIRITLIDKDGNSYHCTSVGIFQQLKNIFKILGEPSEWEEPLVVIPAEGQSGKWKFLTLKY